MTVPFFDLNPGIVNELRAMDHNSKEYKKHLRKVLLEMGGMLYLFNYLKTTDEGNQIRRKYFHNLIVTGVLLASLFVWIILASVIAGGKDPDLSTVAGITFITGFIAIEIASIALAMFFAFRCRRILLQGVSFAIDNYRNEGGGADGGTLENFKFPKSKINRTAIITTILVTIVVVGLRTLLSNGTINNLFSSRAQEFSKAGLTITLTQDFNEQDVVSQTATYISTKYIVITVKDEFAIFEQNNIPTDISLKEYAEAIIDSNSFDATVEGDENRPYFIYNRQANGKDFTYLAIVYRGSDAFWSVIFACESKNFDSSKEQFMKWADTVKVS